MKKNTIKAVSVVAGIVFFSVIAGIAVSRDEHVKKEIKQQIDGFLKTTKSLLDQYQGIVKKIGEVTGYVDSLKSDDVANKQEQTRQKEQAYNHLWEQVEENAQR
jgi:enamine deaminase RidA (YjgF/YER057c/UK114 family)